MNTSTITSSVEPLFACQFYFLLLTERRKGDEHIDEPAHLKDESNSSKSWVNYSQSDDKRLFRFDIPSSTLLELPQRASECWQMLRDEYQYCQVHNYVTDQKIQRDARTELLIGVAVVIIAEKLTDVHITLREDDQELGQMLFSPDKTLLSLNEKDSKEVSRFVAFKSRYVEPFLGKEKPLHWQLAWAKEGPWHLIPIRDGEKR